MKRILMTGVGGPTGRARALFFKQRGYELIGTSVRMLANTVHRFHPVPLGDSGGFQSALLHVLELEEPELMIPTVSEELPKVARMARSVRAGGVQVFISGPAVSAMANDTYLTARALRSLKIPAPVTLIRAKVQSAEKAGERLGCPLIAEPCVDRGGRWSCCLRMERKHASRRDAISYSRSLRRGMSLT